MQLPANLFQYYNDCYGERPSEAVIRLIKHDLVRQVWLLLLDDDFMKAYQYGLLILCTDGILRRVFPRIFLYSADYPEKCVEVSGFSPERLSDLSHRCLITCIKCLGQHTCPDCVMDRNDFWKMGMKSDMAARTKHARKDSSILHDVIAMVCKWTFQDGMTPEGKNVKDTKLGPLSMTPTRVRYLRNHCCDG